MSMRWLQCGIVLIVLFSVVCRSQAQCGRFIVGTWVGEGRASNWFLNCHYAGVGHIVSNGVAKQWQLALTAQKRAGNWICPKNVQREFLIQCDANHKPVVVTRYGNLLAHFSKQSGQAQGRLSFAIGIQIALSLTYDRVMKATSSIDRADTTRRGSDEASEIFR